MPDAMAGGGMVRKTWLIKSGDTSTPVGATDGTGQLLLRCDRTVAASVTAEHRITLAKIGEFEELRRT